MRRWDALALGSLLVSKAGSDSPLGCLEEDGQIVTWLRTRTEVAAAIWIGTRLSPTVKPHLSARPCLAR